MITGKYPNLRLRRNRKQPWIRRLTQENMLSPDDFILPIFLIDGKNKKEKIKSMSDVYRYSIDRIGQIIDKVIKLGIPMVALFPKTSEKLKNLFLNITTNVFKITNGFDYINKEINLDKKFLSFCNILILIPKSLNSCPGFGIVFVSKTTNPAIVL